MRGVVKTVGLLWPPAVIACVVFREPEEIALILLFALPLMWASERLRIWWVFYLTTAFFIGSSVILYALPLLGY
jgi:hypothetical protein